jgi:hypothetical protein
MNEAQTVEALARELRLMEAQPPEPLALKPSEAFTLLAALQLAWRHPQLSPTQKRLIESFGRRLQAFFLAAPVARRWLDDTMRRYSTEAEALKGHAEVVAELGGGSQ